MTPLVGGQRSNKYAFWRANIAIKKENVLVPPCSILLQVMDLQEPVSVNTSGVSSQMFKV